MSSQDQDQDQDQKCEEFEDFYVCQVCGMEDHPDAFGKYCPGCGTDLDELEG